MQFLINEFLTYQFVLAKSDLRYKGSDEDHVFRQAVQSPFLIMVCLLLKRVVTDLSARTVYLDGTLCSSRGQLTRFGGRSTPSFADFGPENQAVVLRQGLLHHSCLALC